MVKSDFLRRTVVALIMAPVVIGSIVFGFPYYSLLLLMVGGMLSWEWSNMLASDRKAVYATVYTLSMATFVMMQSLLGILLILLFSIALVGIKARNEKHKYLLILGVPYISFGIGALMLLMLLYSAPAVLWLLFVVWAVDVGGYLVGCSVKGPKLAPKISPNKTWSGLFGGMGLAALIGWGGAYYFGWENSSFYVYLAAVLAVVEQIGDLVESSIKRVAGVKDSSDIIPGHGGVFDRVDGLIFTAFVLLLGVVLYSMLR